MVKETNKAYRHIMNFATIAIFDSEPEGDNLYELQRFCRMLGFTWSNTDFCVLDKTDMIYLNKGHHLKAHGDKLSITYSTRQYFDTKDFSNSKLQKGPYDFIPDLKKICYMVERLFDIPVPDDIKIELNRGTWDYLEDIENWASVKSDIKFINQILMQQYYQWGDRKRLNQIEYAYRLGQKNSKATGEFIANMY